MKRFRPRLGAALAMLAISLSTAPSTVAAEPQAELSATRLEGLSRTEADRLVQKLKDAQTGLASGERLTFQLLSGAPAFYEMTLTSPREAFLALSFDQPFSIRRTPTDNRLWNPYQLEILPDSPGRLYWKVTAVLGFTGELERVELFHTTPPPY